MRLSTKPGTSRCTMIGSLPMARTKSPPAANTSRVVSPPRITSTAPIMGTGLKKCRPKKRRGSGAWAASWLMGMALVLLATRASAETTGASSR